MLSLPGDTQADVTEAFNSTYRYSDDLLRNG